MERSDGNNYRRIGGLSKLKYLFKRRIEVGEIGARYTLAIRSVVFVRNGSYDLIVSFMPTYSEYYFPEEIIGLGKKFDRYSRPGRSEGTAYLATYCFSCTRPYITLAIIQQFSPSSSER